MTTKGADILTPLGSSERPGGDILEPPSKEELSASAVPKALTSPSTREATTSSSLFNNARDFNVERVYHIQTTNVTFNNAAMLVSEEVPIHEGGEFYKLDSR